MGFTQQRATPASNVQADFRKKQQLAATSLVKNLPLKNIGPNIMSGRVADIEVNPDNPTEFYVGYASGGLWHTKNNGTSFTPIMDNAETINIGDIAVDWNLGTIWVGTGENISSRSSYAGTGLLKSADGGKTWQNMGLTDAHHFGRILIDPNNADHIVVGVTGHLYTPNLERGIYKTTDGGTTWQQTLFINETTGIIDVAATPSNFNTLYAAAWQKDRKAWDFTGNGNASGIYKSTDAGLTWKKLSTPESGLPTGQAVGRIGLAVYDDRTVYAVHDSQFRRPATPRENTDATALQKTDFKTMSKADVKALSNKQLNAFLKSNRFPKQYTAEKVKQMISQGVIEPEDIYRYLTNPNATSYDTEVVGAEVYRSDDGGTTWTRRNKDYIDDLFYSYGYVFAQVRVDANNKNKIYLLGVPIIKSDDGGKTYTSIQKENVHVDHHSLWVNPNTPGHLINGNDGGVNISYDDGETWIKNNSESVGTFFAINVDDQEPYNVYGGLQDNGVWMGPHDAKMDRRWQQTGHHPWKGIAGGDGMQIQIDSRNPHIIYTGSQFGYYSRIDLEHDERTFIRPKHQLGESPYRFNWESPILLSTHNQDILYFGTNKLMRSMNQGNDWTPISPDLTAGGKKGNVPYGTLTTISESPLQFGLLYTGSDDGLVQLSKNGGGSWLNITDGLPKNLWVSTVLASSHKKERIYVALSGYRNDDFTTYLYTSENYGQTWQPISSNMPNAPVNVIIEDPLNQSLLFVGTDNGLYVSLNRGASWEVMQNGMPNVAVHDLVIQPKAKHLIVGTHGRSIYRVAIAALQQMDAELLKKEVHVFALEDIKHSPNWGNRWSQWMESNTPEQPITIYTARASTLDIAIKATDGTLVNTMQLRSEIGLNRVPYDLSFSKKGLHAFLRKNKMKLTAAKNGKTYLPKGVYEVEVRNDGKIATVAFKIK